MNETDQIIVMKFGGASLATPNHFTMVADCIEKRRQNDKRIVVVVSAMLETTNQLIDLAKTINPNPPQREYDMLISVGERISMSLLAMALDLKKIPAISLTGSQSGIITCTKHTEATIIDVRPQRIFEALQKDYVVIIAGFQGVSTTREITTLGRGGSDTTAVALGIALDAQRVEFYKDVPGICSHDPKVHPDAELYSALSYEQAKEILSGGAKVLHMRALQMAERHAIPLCVRSLSSSGTHIGEQNTKAPFKVYEQL